MSKKRFSVAMLRLEMRYSLTAQGFLDDGENRSGALAVSYLNCRALLDMWYAKENFLDREAITASPV
jgi:hypothetical protein